MNPRPKFFFYPPIKYKTQQIWPTFSCKSFSFIIYWPQMAKNSFLPPLARISGNIFTSAPVRALIIKNVFCPNFKPELIFSP